MSSVDLEVPPSTSPHDGSHHTATSMYPGSTPWWKNPSLFYSWDLTAFRKCSFGSRSGLSIQESLAYPHSTAFIDTTDYGFMREARFPTTRPQQDIRVNFPAAKVGRTDTGSIAMHVWLHFLVIVDSILDTNL